MFHKLTIAFAMLVPFLIGMDSTQSRQPAKQSAKPVLALQFIKRPDSVVLFEYDPAKNALTINGAAIATDTWIYAYYEHGRTGKRSGAVAMFLVADAPEQAQ
jgi:hypothetical protein